MKKIFLALCLITSHINARPIQNQFKTLKRNNPREKRRKMERKVLAVLKDKGYIPRDRNDAIAYCGQIIMPLFWFGLFHTGKYLVNGFYYAFSNSETEIREL